jgi:hypothetical protein
MFNYSIRTETKLIKIKLQNANSKIQITKFYMNALFIIDDIRWVQRHTTPCNPDYSV